MCCQGDCVVHGSAPSVGKLKRVQDVGEQQMCFLTSCSRHFMNIYPFIFFYIHWHKYLVHFLVEQILTLDKYNQRKYKIQFLNDFDKNYIIPMSTIVVAV